MITAGALRVVEREAHVFRRLWRGSAFSTFLTPVLFLVGIAATQTAAFVARRRTLGRSDPEGAPVQDRSPV